MKLDTTFESSKYSNMQDGFPLLPEGDYHMCVTKGDIKPTKLRNGRYIELEMTVLSGNYKGHKLLSFIVFDHPNPTTTAKANEHLATICRATGVLNVDNLSQFYRIPMIVSVVEDGKYNRPISYKPYEQKDTQPPFIEENNVSRETSDSSSNISSNSNDPPWITTPVSENKKEDEFKEDDIPF